MNEAFTIFPLTQEMELEAGKTYMGFLNVANPADATSDFYFAVEVKPYSVIGENYDADLATKSTWSQIADWVTILTPTGVLKPNEVKQIEFLIKVPVDAPAGGQYMALAVRSDAPGTAANGTNIQNVYEMAGIVFAEIKGETTRTGAVESNSVPGFVTNGSVMVGALISNTGNVHETAEVTITVKNLVTGEVILPREGADGVYHELIMPATSRFVSREVNELPALGIFEVSQSISYLGETSVDVSTVVMCPIWFLFLTVLTAGALIGTVAGLVVKHRRQKKLEKAI